MMAPRSEGGRKNSLGDNRVLVIAAALAVLALILALPTACGGSADTTFREQGLATGAPGMNLYSDKEPGQAGILPRPYEGAPPLVPHDVSKMKVTREKNDCVGCHQEGIKVSQDAATKIPASHYQGTELAGIRYNCRECHVPQAEGEPPVQQMNTT